MGSRYPNFIIQPQRYSYERSSHALRTEHVAKEL